MKSYLMNNILVFYEGDIKLYSLIPYSNFIVISFVPWRERDQEREKLKKDIKSI